MWGLELGIDGDADEHGRLRRTLLTVKQVGQIDVVVVVSVEHRGAGQGGLPARAGEASLESYDVGQVHVAVVVPVALDRRLDDEFGENARIAGLCADRHFLPANDPLRLDGKFNNTLAFGDLHGSGNRGNLRGTALQCNEDSTRTGRTD